MLLLCRLRPSSVINQRRRSSRRRRRRATTPSTPHTTRRCRGRISRTLRIHCVRSAAASLFTASSVVDPKSFFSDSDPQFFSDSDPYTNILTRNFLKWRLIALICVLESLRQRKKGFPTEKLMFFFLFQVFYLLFFTKKVFNSCTDS
jgi:hypothetical protein